MTDRLRAARDAMDPIHKRLLEAARADYETVRGPIGGPARFLELLTNDPFFAWLRPMTRLMVEIDEALDEPEALDPPRVDAFRARLETLLLDPRYLHYLQLSPDLVIDHAALRRALASF